MPDERQPKGVIRQQVENRLITIDLDRARAVRRIREKVEAGHVPTPSERWRTRRTFAIWRAEERRLREWLARQGAKNDQP